MEYNEEQVQCDACLCWYPIKDCNFCDICEHYYCQSCWGERDACPQCSLNWDYLDDDDWKQGV